MSLRLNAADITNVGSPVAGPLLASTDAGTAPVPPGFAALLQLGEETGPASGTGAQASGGTRADGKADIQLLQTGRMRVRPMREKEDADTSMGFATQATTLPQLPIAVATSPLDTNAIDAPVDATPDLSAINVLAPKAGPAVMDQPGAIAGATGSLQPATIVLPATTSLSANSSTQPQAAVGAAPIDADASPSDVPTAASVAGPALGQPALTPQMSPQVAFILSDYSSSAPAVTMQANSSGESKPVTARSAGMPSRQSSSEPKPTGSTNNSPTGAQASNVDDSLRAEPPAPSAPVSMQHADVKATAASADTGAQTSIGAPLAANTAPAAVAVPALASTPNASGAAHGVSFSSNAAGSFAVSPDSPASNSGDDSSQAGSNRSSGTPAAGRTDRKSRSAELEPATGDGVRFGMGGWVASSQSPETAGAHAETALPAWTSAAMTQMAVDRTASDSSARRLNNALQSDMAMGVQTDAFGRVHIQTSVIGRELSAQISLEHTHAASNGLVAQMPALEDALRQKYGVSASVSVRPDSGSATNSSGNGQSRNDEQPRKAPESYVAPYQSGALSTSTLLNGRPAAAWPSTSSSSGGLDITI